MEKYWALVSYARIIVKMIIMGYILYRFVKPFMQNKAGAFFTGVFYFATILVLYLIPVEIDNFAAYAIGMSAAFIVMYRLDYRNLQQKIFIAVTFFSIRYLSVYMTGILTKEMYRKIIDAEYMIEHPYIQLLIYIAIEILDVLINSAVAGIGVWRIVKAYTYKDENMSIKELFMLCVPSITGLTGYGIIQYYQTNLEIRKNGAYHILEFLHFGISILTIVVVTVLFQNIKARQEEKIQNELLAVQIDSTEKHIAQVERLYQNIRSIKHDMTNHILTIERLYAKGRMDEAKAYGVELKAVLSEMTGEIKSGNPVTDVILQEIKMEAEKRNICFRSDFYFPKDSHINTFDISVILNNALQNAMENIGEVETPYIFVHSYHRAHAYMIEIRNSFTGSLQWDAENELPVTTKRKADGHGYGLANIRRLARKYSGDIAIDVKNDEFCISIMLIMGNMQD